jgi:MFS family permease
MRNTLARISVVFVVFCTTFASNGPSVLYVVYQARDHFSSLVVTAIFSTYAVAVLATLLLVGRLSDVLGRRPVLIGGSVLLVASSLLFAIASSALWLFFARGLQGVATGTLIAAAGAALVELSPPQQRRNASLINTIAFLSGAASGSIAFGVMVQYLPSPTVLPFVLEMVLDSLAVLLVALACTETVKLTGEERWRLQRPSVPRPMRRAFARCALTMGLGWSIGGLYGSLSPTMARQILHVSSHLVAGAILCLFNLIGGLAQLGASRRRPRSVMVTGLVLLALGATVIQLAFSARSAPFFFLATLFAGAGGGMCFVGSLAIVNELAPALRRAETLAAYNLVGYLALSVPIVSVGLLAQEIGLRKASLAFSTLLVLGAVLLLASIRSPASLRAEERLGELEALPA